MVAYFKRECYLFSGAGAGVGLLAAALLYPGYLSGMFAPVCAFYVALLIIAGIIAGRLYAVVWAGKRLRTINAILYQQGNPREFLNVFTPVVQRTKQDTAEAMTGWVKLAYAHEALGQFQQGLDLLKNLDPDSLKLHALLTAANLRNQQLRLALLMEDLELADGFLADLQHLQELAQGRAATTAANLTECIRLAQCWRQVLLEESTDEAYLAEEIRLSTNDIHKSEIQILLARAYANRDDIDAADDLLVEAKATGRGLWTTQKAEALIRTLSE